MPFDSAALVREITQLQHHTVAGWHQVEPDNQYEGLLQIVCQQHQFNFLLWHEEDIARSPNVGDERIAQVKRAIDGYNQNRNDYIERVDEAIIHLLAAEGVAPLPARGSIPKLREVRLIVCRSCPFAFITWTSS